MHQEFTGRASTALVQSLRPDDSIVTFNWDLLLDECFLGQSFPNGPPVQYSNFRRRIDDIKEGELVLQNAPGMGLFLKLHGSLNWFQCSNERCSASRKLILRDDIDGCLDWTMGINKSFLCMKCGSETLPLIVPPILRKQIVEHETTRAAWGLARRTLESANVLVTIGFSAAPTDYYSSWLFRGAAAGSNSGLRRALGLPPLRVIIVNPLNDPQSEGHQDFKMRMQRLFPSGYSDEFKTFSEIAAFRQRALEMENTR
jgi:hypothetical protein